MHVVPIVGGATPIVHQLPGVPLRPPGGLMPFPSFVVAQPGGLHRVPGTAPPLLGPRPIAPLGGGDIGLAAKGAPTSAPPSLGLPGAPPPGVQTVVRRPPTVVDGGIVG